MYKVSTPCLDDHPLKMEEQESVGEVSKKLTDCLINACIWHEVVGRDILSSVNKLAKSCHKMDLMHVVDPHRVHQVVLPFFAACFHVSQQSGTFKALFSPLHSIQSCISLASRR